MTRSTLITSATVALALAGCGKQSVLAPAGPGAASLARLGWIALLSLSAIAVIVLVLIVWASLRRRGSLEEHAPIDDPGDTRWIVIGGLFVPAIVLAILFVMTLRGLDAFPLHDGEHRSADLRVVGKQWWWEVEYFGETPGQNLRTANEIHIPVGQPIELELESADVIHSFWVPKLHGKLDLIPGRSNRLRLQADAPGVFLGQCAEFCGSQHAQMRLVVVAEPPREFAEWVAQQATPGATPTEQAELRGKQLFETRACGLCHTVRGTAAAGRIGPDLTHLASRRMLAANSLPNSHAYLQAWITRAQSFKAEAAMPNLTDFSGEELNALTAYLRQLR